jgi:hypothetical protein
MEFILGLLAHGVSIEEILKEHPSLEKDYIYACLFFASKILADASFVPLRQRPVDALSGRRVRWAIYHSLATQEKS